MPTSQLLMPISQLRSQLLIPISQLLIPLRKLRPPSQLILPRKKNLPSLLMTRKRLMKRLRIRMVWH